MPENIISILDKTSNSEMLLAKSCPILLAAVTISSLVTNVVAAVDCVSVMCAKDEQAIFF